MTLWPDALCNILIGLDGNAAALLDCDEQGQVKVCLLSPPDVSFHYEISFFKSGNTSVPDPIEGKVGSK